MSHIQKRIPQIPKDVQHYIRDKLPVVDRPKHPIYSSINTKLALSGPCLNIRSTIGRRLRSELNQYSSGLSNNTLQSLFTNGIYNKLAIIKDMIFEVYTHYSTYTAMHGSSAYRYAPHSEKIHTSQKYGSLMRIQTVFDSSYYGFSEQQSITPAYRMNNSYKLNSKGDRIKYMDIEYVPTPGHETPYPREITINDFCRPLLELINFKKELPGKKCKVVHDYIDTILYQFCVILSFLHRKYRDAKIKDQRTKYETSRKTLNKKEKLVTETSNAVQNLKEQLAQLQSQLVE